MRWNEALKIRHSSGAAHAFVLHLNTYDLHIRDGTFQETKDFILAESPFKDAEFVAFFNRAEGIYFADENMEKRFLSFLGKFYPVRTSNLADADAVRDFKRHRKEIDYMFFLFSDMLKIGWNDTRENTIRAFEEEKPFGKEYAEERKEKGAPFFVAIIEYADSLSPQGAMHSAQAGDRNAIVGFLSWARSGAIARAKNAAVLLTEVLGSSAEELAQDTTGVIPVEIPFLAFEDRLETMRVLKNEFPSGDFGISQEEVARISGGLSRRNLAQVVRETLGLGKKLSYDEIFERKRKHLEERAHGLMEIVRSLYGFDAVGGLEVIINFLKKVAEAMRAGNTLRVPQGIFFSGPPGTGKTIMALALAHEAGVEMIQFLNLMNMYVGMSETNQEYALKLAISYAPILGFMDEIEQMFLRRGTFYSGDAGVFERQQRGFLKIMSDTDLRGQILWVGASNRPQAMDPAFMREGRFDIVIPFLEPADEKERGKILPAILYKMARQAEAKRQKFEHRIPDNFIEEFGMLTHGHYKEGEGWLECTESAHRDETEHIEGYVGSECEAIIMLAHWRAQRQGRLMTEDDIRHVVKHEFIPKRNMQEFREATDATLSFCNVMEFIPEKFRKQVRKVRGRQERINDGQYL